MSGICGIVLRDGPPPSDALDPAPMVRALGPHGREGGSTATLGPALLGAGAPAVARAGLAQRVVDGQPVALAFHGTLFDTASWSDERERGFRLEDLVTLFLEEGPGFLRRLRGDFALAVWDGRSRALHLAVDHFRVHPLFYVVDARKLVFATRIRALRACPLPLALSIDPESVVQVVASSMVPSPGTIFAEVKKLPPGHRLTFRQGDVEIAPYWDVDFRRRAPGGERKLAEELRSSLSEALEVRLAHDADPGRIGTYLSGGIDSSTVTGLITRLSGRPVRSFTIGFGEPRFDETHYAQVAAAAFGSPLTQYFVTPADTVACIPVLLDAFDEPFANASAVPAYYCAKRAKEAGVETLYAGDGGDELFAGNERYAVQRLFGYYERFPRWVRRGVLEPVVFGLAGRGSGGPVVAAKKYILRAREPSPGRLSSYGFFRAVPPSEFFDDRLLEAIGRDYDPYGPIGLHYHRAPADTELDRELYVDLKLTISDNDLLKVNRTAEAAGIAVRYPFLDHRLAEFGAAVPARIKMRGRKLRSFFKAAYADLLPAETLAKHKHGFGLPIPVWLRTDRRLNETMKDLLLGPTIAQRGYFRKGALERLVDLHRTDETSFYGTVLWHLMVLELWLRREPA